MSSEDWVANAKYILRAIDDLTEDQKELTKLNKELYKKIENYHTLITCQSENCGKKYISRWVLGIVVTLIVGAFSFIGIDSANIYNRISTNTTAIDSNKTKIDVLEDCVDEIKQNIHLGKGRKPLK